MQVFCNSFAKVFKILTTGDKNKDYKIWDLQSSEIKHLILHRLDSILLFLKANHKYYCHYFFGKCTIGLVIGLILAFYC